jgi:hypothetical protein
MNAATAEAEHFKALAVRIRGQDRIDSVSHVAASHCPHSHDPHGDRSDIEIPYTTDWKYR